MIEYASGDMFAIETDVRINTVNCVGVMGTGVALAFKRRYPAMFKEYQYKCRTGLIHPGKIDVWKTLTGEWVINFPTKRDWRERSRYEYIDAGLDDLRTYLEAQGKITVAIPALGCGHGGLDWSRVRPMIVEKLGGLSNASISVFEPADSREAGETELRRDLRDRAFQEVGLTDLDPDGEGYSGSSDSDVFQQKAFLKGDPSLVATQWIGLMPSKAPKEREWVALESIADEMGRRAKSVVAFVYATRATEEIARLFLARGNAVILILPFGPLSRTAPTLDLSSDRDAKYAIVSIAKPQASWSHSLHANAQALFRAGSVRILLTDPEPKWLQNLDASKRLERPMFYLSYGNLADDLRHTLREIHARPLGRLATTGEPNLQPLLDTIELRMKEPAAGVDAPCDPQLSFLD